VTSMDSTMPQVVIVGAGYAGLSAAHRLSGRADIVVVSPGSRFVDRIRLHQFAAGGCTEDQVAPRLTDVLPASARHVEGTVVAVEPGRVLLDGGTQLTADHIIVSAGSGIGGGVTNLESSREVRDRLALLSAGSLVRIDGAGHTGVELASEIAECRPDVNVVLTDPAGLLPRMSETAQRKARRHLHRVGVTLMSELPQTESAEIVIDCTGFDTPHIEGLSAPDDTLGLGEGLWVAGDIANTGHRWSCAAAEPMGAHVADNILRVARGEDPAPFEFGFFIQCVSLGRSQGLIQVARPNDDPRRIVLSGRLAAFVKERICRMALRIATSKSAVRYRWPRGPLVHEVLENRSKRRAVAT
jgi:NADH dehydrogenase